MAYFECTTGIGAGGGATITVTYNSSFYNKTMTCSNGTKTYTKTTTSSGSTEFKVSDEGTWTITCNGVSRTVLVTLNYSTQMMVTKTVTVYSAANDTVSFTDAVGSKTVTTNASGQGSVSITFIPPSLSITFTSSVAKNPNNLSQNYSKSITITESTTSVYVMPDGAIYWYGYKTSVFQECSSSNGWSIQSGFSFIAPTYATNYIGITSTSSNLCCVAGLVAPSSGKKLKAISTNNVPSGAIHGMGVFMSSGKQVANTPTHTWADASSTPTLITYTYTASTSYYVIGGDFYPGRGGNIYALMYE